MICQQLSTLCPLSLHNISQAERRRQRLSSGIIGNRSSTGYLDGLSGGSPATTTAAEGGAGTWGGGAMYKRQQGENNQEDN